MYTIVIGQSTKWPQSTARLLLCHMYHACSNNNNNNNKAILQAAGDPTSVTSDAAPEAHLVIWGTDVNVQETKRKFVQFLKTFVDDLPEGDGGESPANRVEPLYMTRLEEVGTQHVTRKYHFQGII